MGPGVGLAAVLEVVGQVVVVKNVVAYVVSGVREAPSSCCCL